MANNIVVLVRRLVAMSLTAMWHLPLHRVDMAIAHSRGDVARCCSVGVCRSSWGHEATSVEAPGFHSEKVVEGGEG
jgi:hypothetical protein